MNIQTDKYFARNATGVAFVEFFWGLGFPVIMESTFLQIFLKNMGASDVAIGMVPAILMIGMAVFPLFSSFLTRNLEHKRSMVIGLHMVSSVSTMAFGLFLFQVKDPALILPVFFISYIVFSLCIGLTFPVWLNFLVKIFSPEKNVQGLAIMFTTQNIAKIISSIFIIKTVETYSFSLISAAWVFLIAGILFLLGSLCFLLTVELPDTSPGLRLKGSFLNHIWTTIREITGNRNLVKYLIGDLDHYIVITVIAFYANYAIQYHGIQDYTAAGLFVCFIYIGAICANLLLGTFNLLSLKNKFLITKLINLVMLSVLIFAPGFSGFLFASFLLGVCRGIRGIIYSPMIKKFSRRNDATAYFAAVPLLTIIFASGFPLFFGHMLDRLAYMGQGAYQLMFGLCMICVMICFAAGHLTDFDPGPEKR
ncbi:MAG: MFS transporter [Proteobacteria bacterium]|nr:MFS transporter [Pseudomonadota bacterium]MBU1389898.1 MFS transporter [Pseudomonadota bacterium]MBU1543907.1 MFS transporter [Pseudomonadota bacterium]MBU2482185.1 MFS transporter [Pseudomonadota bacterium]